MGRFFFFILLVGTGWFLLNVIGVSIDPRAVAPALSKTKLVLAQSVQIRDCQSLLR